MRYKLAVEKLRLLAEACDIEVSRQPPAAVAVQQRRQADGHFPGQMRDINCHPLSQWDQKVFR